MSCLLRVPLELLELYEESVVEFLTEEHKELSEYVASQAVIMSHFQNL